MSYLRYQRYHGILRFRYLTIPAPSGIFNSHTYDTNDTPVFWDFETLPYRLDQVFSDVIPTTPTIPRYFEISIPYHTGSIRYFQQSYPRYQRYPGILRFRYLTIPPRSGIFNSHTYDTNDTPVFWYFDTLPYRLDQVSSTVIPTVPTRTPVWNTQGIYPGYVGYGTLPTVPVMYWKVPMRQ